MDNPSEAVPDAYRQTVKKAMIINVVDIDPADGEEALSNNKAIEIVPASPKPFSILIP